MAACGDSSATKMNAILFNGADKTTVLAHRGLWGKYAGIADLPENSRGALQAANDQCMDGVELDVKLTSDGVPVLLHDYNLAAPPPCGSSIPASNTTRSPTRA